jgi:hypothetical protein
MKKNNTVKPTGLKGNQVLDRMRELMGTPINESRTNSVVELTKKGPDGKIYGIVRENHEYYIKTVKSDKDSGLVAEDFQYIGGLQNKKQEAYPTYAKAIKKLNLKFLSLNESFGGPRVNVFEDDNLQEAAAFGFGFVEEEVVEEMENNDGKGTKTDKETSGDNLDGDFDENPKASSTNTGRHKAGEQGHEEHIIGEDVELTEDEKAIDSMVTGESLDPVGKEDSDMDNDGDSDETDDYLINRRMKIAKAIDIEESEDKMEKLIESLSDEEAQALVEALKKKV